MAREIKAEPFTGGAVAHAPGWKVRRGNTTWTLWGPRPEQTHTFAHREPVVTKARPDWQIAHDSSGYGYATKNWHRDTLDEVLALCPPAVARAVGAVAR